MKNIFLNLLLIFAFVSTINAQKMVTKDGYQFEKVYDCACTEVKSQGQTGTCWSFSTVSYLESEMMRSGKAPIDLSEMYFVRHTYNKKAQKYLRYHGKTNFSEGSLGHDVLFALKDHGAMPESAYSGIVGNAPKHNHGKMAKELTTYLKRLLKLDEIPLTWRDSFNLIMDKHIGKVPENFEYNGNNYTPESFSKKLVGLDADDYVSISSFSHHPFYETFVLEVPDNFSDGTFYNVPFEELAAIADYALQNGHSLEWDCDVSERGFSAKQGMAILPDKKGMIEANEMNEFFRTPHPQMTVTQEMRQQEFDTHSLTDDHLMHIVGLSKDQTGNEYYVTKNSWGTKNLGFNGYIYASKEYFLMNTISIVVHKDAIPDRIKAKLNL